MALLSGKNNRKSTEDIMRYITQSRDEKEQVVVKRTLGAEIRLSATP